MQMNQEIVNAQYIGHGSPFEHPTLNRMLVSIRGCKNIVGKMCIRCRQLTRLKNSGARGAMSRRGESTALGKAVVMGVGLRHIGKGKAEGRGGSGRARRRQ